APKVCYPNVYGIDMPTAKELIAHDRTTDEVAKAIGADWLVYQELNDVYDAVNSAAKSDADKIQRFEDSVFTGDYITGGVDKNYFEHIAAMRSDDAKKKKRKVNGDDLVSNVEEL
ncbi:MAG: amidophosphoribosyltransferase, partial [Coxiellaceae bacterium]|nr:amidophosphoribosyltransferase [Coxiellaceae bacterium]